MYVDYGRSPEIRMAPTLPGAAAGTRWQVNFLGGGLGRLTAVVATLGKWRVES
jgi:hypothetical protein